MQQLYSFDGQNYTLILLDLENQGKVLRNERKNDVGQNTLFTSIVFLWVKLFFSKPFQTFTAYETRQC